MGRRGKGQPARGEGAIPSKRLPLLTRPPYECWA